MAAVTKLDSNATGLRITEEDSFEVVSGDEVWTPYAPNSYGDFGGENTLVASEPIVDHRQVEKGVITDREAGASFNTDLKYSNMQSLMQGFMFADLNTNVELAIATVDGTGNDYEPASGGDGFIVNDLVFAKGFDDASNNGINLVTGTPTASSVGVASLTTAATQTGTISKVGHQYTATEVSVVVSGDYPAYTFATQDPTDLGLSPGDMFFMGGDLTAEQFASAVNNGYKRVRAVTATTIVVDKSSSDMVVDAGTGKTIRIYTGRYLKNRSTASEITRRTYQLERSLGAPDDASPAQIQAEYVTGAVPSEMTLNVPANEKATVDLAFIGTEHSFIDAATSLKAGTRPALTSEGIFNTSSHIPLIRLASVTALDESPAPLFAYVTDFSLTVNNNVNLAKAVGKIGGFETVTGKFMVSGSMTAYLADIASMQAVQNNDDVTLDIHFYQENTGISIDIPVMALSDGRAGVGQDEAVTVPLPFTAGRGTKVFSGYDHTLHMSFFDYLPALAATQP